MSTQDIIHAYRHLYRQGLRAVQFSKPARFTLRDRLRLAFRKNSPADYNPQKIRTTFEFLQHATTHNGMEHKIVKNLLFIWWCQEDGGKKNPTSITLCVTPRSSDHWTPLLVLIEANRTQEEIRIRQTAFDAFNHNIEMLNESMDLCIPAMTVRDPN